MTNHRMQNPGGTELFVLEIAVALSCLGHQLCVFSTVGGAISSRLESAGIAFVSDPALCPFTPDIIHGQHHLETMAALCCWPRTPAVYFVHGATPWEESAPRHPRIGRYIGTSPRFGWMVARACGIDESELVVAPNYFDARRFTQVRPPGTKTGRALVFHNTMEPNGRAYQALNQACQNADLVLEGAGQSFGRMVEKPQDFLTEFDVVFAGGRSAIEAMACGCAVIPVTAEQSAEWVCPENFGELAMRNFTAEINAPPAEVGRVFEELLKIKPDAVIEVTRRIRQEATLERTLKILTDCYQSVLANPPPPSPEKEAADLGYYLLGIAQKVKDADDRRASLVDQKNKAVARAARWKDRAEELSAQLQWLSGESESGPWYRRLCWRLLTRARRQKSISKKAGQTNDLSED